MGSQESRMDNADLLRRRDVGLQEGRGVSVMNILTKRGWRFLGFVFAFGYAIGVAFVIFAVMTITNMSMYEACLMVGRVLLSSIGGAWIATKVWGIVRRWLWV